MNDLTLVDDCELEPWPDEADPPPRQGAGGWFGAIDGVPPNPASAAIVTMLDARRMNGHDQLRLIRAQQELVSYATAQLYRSMAELVRTIASEDDLDANAPEEAAAAEIGAALNLTRRTAEYELLTALDLHRRLPSVLDALTEGRIDVRRARTMIRATEHLSIARARTVAEAVLPHASDLTSGQLASELRRRCVDLEPEDAQRRYDNAVADRRVVAEPTVAGTGNLFALDLAPHRLESGMRHMNRIARGLRGPDEARTMDQLRADVFLDLINGDDPAGGTSDRAVVDIHVELTTLAGLDDQSGDLAGFGPVVADIARQTVAAQPDALWRFTVTDARTDDIVHTGTTRYRATAAERREVHARYRTCVHPGCRMPATQSDLDHVTPYGDDGPTEVANLAPLCRHHHRVRHEYGWRYRRLDSGHHEWVSPLGHRYTVAPRGP